MQTQPLSRRKYLQICRIPVKQDNGEKISPRDTGRNKGCRSTLDFHLAHAIMVVRSKKRKERNGLNQRIRGNYEALAQCARLRLDGESGALYGERGGFGVTVYAANDRYPYLLTVLLSAQRPGGPLTREEGKAFKSSCKPVGALTQNGTLLTMTLKNTGNQAKLQDNLSEALNELVRFLHTSGYQDCCQTCGKTGPTDACFVAGGHLRLCTDCFTTMQRSGAVSSTRKAQKRENVLGGIVGALLGSLLGVVCIIILSQLGYIAALSGVVMAVCTLKGYDLLGGKLTKKGIVICIVLMLVMTFVGDRADWAIVISREVGVDLAIAFRAIPMLLEEELIVPSSYWGNLVLLYLFLLVGAIPTILNTLKNEKVAKRIYRLGVGVSEE